MRHTVGMSDHVGGVVLAAGAGTRYGMPKVLAADGQWLRSAVSALATADATTSSWCWAPRSSTCRRPARAGGRERLGGRDGRIAAGGHIGARIRTRGVRRADHRRHARHRRRRCRRVLAAARAVVVGTGAGRLRPAARASRRHRAQALAVTRRTRGRGRRRPGRSCSGRDDVAWVDCADLASGADIDVNPNRDAERRGGEPAHRLLSRPSVRVGVCTSRVAGRTRRRGPGPASASAHQPHRWSARTRPRRSTAIGRERRANTKRRH